MTYRFKFSYSLLDYCMHLVSLPNGRNKPNKTAELSQRRPRDAPNIWAHWKVLRVLTAHPATFSEICNGLLFRSIIRMCVQNLKFVALPVPEIIGGTQTFGQSLDTPTLHFLPKFERAFVCMDPVNIPAKFEVRSFTRSGDNRGYTQKHWAVPGYVHAPFSPKFFMGLCSDGPSECIGQICSP